MKVEFIKDFATYKKGDTANNFSLILVSRLFKRGVAKEYKERRKKETK
ncbi:hypothetical protein [Tenacibaculum phage JQ]|nr:hypothetical protein [Tenacibaculum phage JQ]